MNTINKQKLLELIAEIAPGRATAEHESNDNDKFLKKYNFRINSLPFDFYNDFINYWTKERHDKIIKNISNFINSSDYKMQKKHINN